MQQLVCGPVTPGLYVDDAPSRASTEAYIRRAVGIGYEHLCIMLDGHGEGLADLRWRPDQLERMRAVCEPAGVARIGTLWPEPTMAYMDELEKKLPSLLEALGARSVELDMEGANWDAKKLKGFRTLEAAELALIDTLREVGCETYEVVSFMARLGTIKTLVRAKQDNGEPRCSLFSLMTYPRRFRNGRQVPYSSPFGPKIVGTHLDALAQEIPSDVRVASACSAWGQDWPGVEPFEAMREAREYAVNRGIQVIRDWSSKWVIGARATGYSEPALRRLYQPALS